ncbi:MAG: class B sortase [Coriobacteriia bacterium]|nr:class B sortase [Coriobacteriia bacterium]
MSEARPKKRTPVIVALILVIIVCLAGAITGGVYLLSVNQQISDVENSAQVTPAAPEPKLEKNPIDFTSLREQNKHIYAWIYVPGTKVNYAVCQSKNNAFYLDHNEKREKSSLGAIFSEDYNAKDFQDPVTILYGHNGAKSTMFGSLHKFSDKDFFKKNKVMYVYAPGHIYTYKIVSAYTTNNRHLMGAYNFYNADQLASFQEQVLNPAAVDKNVRKKTTLDASSKLLVLSTCNTGALAKSARYLVIGVMTNDQPTK